MMDNNKVILWKTKQRMIDLLIKAAPEHGQSSKAPSLKKMLLTDPY